MKLIIDISDKKYKWIKEDTLCYTDEISEAIRQGTPLEDIKAEIQKELGKVKGNSGCDYFTNNTIDNCTHIIMKILDNHIKENDQKESRCDTCKWNDEELSGECYDCVKGIEDWYEPIEGNKQ